jgi:hypothetical protein
VSVDYCDYRLVRIAGLLKKLRIGQWNILVSTYTGARRPPDGHAAPLSPLSAFPWPESALPAVLCSVEEEEKGGKGNRNFSLGLVVNPMTHMNSSFGRWFNL